jgi:DNA-binding NarL/FixJ family response regulator
MPIRVLVVDDSKTVRLGLQKIFRADPNTFEWAGEAASAKEGHKLALKLKPDVILMDVRMPGIDGVEATRRIKSDLPSANIVGFSIMDDSALARKMLDAGAAGYVIKPSPVDDLLKAIRAAARGTHSSQDRSANHANTPLGSA